MNAPALHLGIPTRTRTIHYTSPWILPAARQTLTPQFDSQFRPLQVVCLYKAAGDACSPVLHRFTWLSPHSMKVTIMLPFLHNLAGTSMWWRGGGRDGAGEGKDCRDTERQGGGGEGGRLSVCKETLWSVEDSRWERPFDGRQAGMAFGRPQEGWWCTGLMQQTQTLPSIMFSSQKLHWQNIQSRLRNWNAEAKQAKQKCCAKVFSPSGLCLFTSVRSICLGAQVCV